MSDRVGGWSFFYPVAPYGLPYFPDLGLSLTKLGETARVSLMNVTLEGSGLKKLRHNQRKMAKEGLSMETLPAAQATERFGDFK